jgi:hypothetical protein
LNAISVIRDDDPPVLLFNVILPAGRRNPSVLVPRTPPLKRGRSNTSLASVENNFHVYHPCGDKYENIYFKGGVKDPDTTKYLQIDS